MVRTTHPSWMENTPEIQQARTLLQNRGRGEWTFYTTLGHIVTKIIEMDIHIPLPDGTEYRPFQTAADVNTVFDITPEQYADTPNRYRMDHHLSQFCMSHLRSKVDALLDPQRAWVGEFFTLNVWAMVEDNTDIDTLFSEIRALAGMGIVGIGAYECADVIDLMVGTLLGAGSTIADWKKIGPQTKKKYSVSLLEKRRFTDSFADTVVGLPWRRSPESHAMDPYEKMIKALYVIDADLEGYVESGGLTPVSSI